jgi:aminoglycoside phosphotransferase (APT) family kinase protein
VTETVAALLRHVRERGVPGVPAPGEWLDGDVPAYPMPEWVWAETVLDDAARWLRLFHDATVDFPREGRAWMLPARVPDEVICHNDFAPYNMVFRGGRLAGVIDYETVGPGPRAWDLAYLAYRLVPLAAPANPDLPARPDAEARLARLCDAYGGAEPEQVRALIAPRLDELAEWTAARGGEFVAHAAQYRADAAFLRER